MTIAFTTMTAHVEMRYGMLVEILGIIAGETAWISGIITFIKCVRIRDKRIRDIKYATSVKQEESTALIARAMNQRPMEADLGRIEQRITVLEAAPQREVNPRTSYYGNVLMGIEKPFE